MSRSEATRSPCCGRVNAPETVPAAYPPSPFVISHSREIVSLKSQHRLRSKAIGINNPPTCHLLPWEIQENYVLERWVCDPATLDYPTLYVRVTKHALLGVKSYPHIT